MRGKPGYLIQILDGGKAIARHAQQEPQFQALKKMFIEYLDEDFAPILNPDKTPKTGLKSVDKLKIIGYVD